MGEPRRTPLYETHHKLGARLIDFGGWKMPVQYSGIVSEHLAVRSSCGLFDISHMGELMVGGAHAADFLDHALTNTASTLSVGEAQYSLMCNDQGGVVDDLYVYRIAREVFLLIVNASRFEEDFAELKRLVLEFGEGRTVNVVDESGAFAAVALQGPKCRLFVDDLFTLEGSIRGGKPSDLEKNQVDAFIFNGEIIYMANTGYTGEDGFELIAPNSVIEALWQRIMILGEPHGIQPIGLGARDTLRMEMGYPLYGQELSKDISPLEAGLGYFVKLDKSFRGRAELAFQKKEGVSRRNMGFVMTEKSPPPRTGYPVWFNDELVGQVTSGTQSPSLDAGIGMALINQPHAKIGTTVHIEIRNRRFPAELKKKPLYQQS